MKAGVRNQIEAEVIEVKKGEVMSQVWISSIKAHFLFGIGAVTKVTASK